MFHCPQYSQIQSNDSTPFSATEERSKQWHSDKKGQQEYDDNGDDDDDDDDYDDDNDNYGDGGGAKKKQKRPPTPFRPHARRTCSSSNTRLHCRGW